MARQGLTHFAQPILDILAEMIAYDSSLDIRSRPAGGINLSDIPNVGLD
jgi:import receptor subunit TOM20